MYNMLLFNQQRTERAFSWESISRSANTCSQTTSSLPSISPILQFQARAGIMNDTTVSSF